MLKYNFFFDYLSISDLNQNLENLSLNLVVYENPRIYYI